MRARSCARSSALLAVDVHELELEVAVAVLAGRLKQEGDGVAGVLRLHQGCRGALRGRKSAVAACKPGSACTSLHAGSKRQRAFMVIMSSLSAHFRHLNMLAMFMPARAAAGAPCSGVHHCGSIHFTAHSCWQAACTSC